VRLFEKDGSQHKRKEDNDAENLETPLNKSVARF